MDEHVERRLSGAQRVLLAAIAAAAGTAALLLVSSPAQADDPFEDRTTTLVASVGALAEPLVPVAPSASSAPVTAPVEHVLGTATSVLQPVEPVVDPVAETVVRPVVQPVAASVVQPVAASVVEPVVGSVVRPVLGSVTHELVDPVLDGTLDTVEHLTGAVDDTVIDPLLPPVGAQIVDAPLLPSVPGGGPATDVVGTAGAALDGTDVVASSPASVLRSAALRTSDAAASAPGAAIALPSGTDGPVHPGGDGSLPALPSAPAPSGGSNAGATGPAPTPGQSATRADLLLLPAPAVAAASRADDDRLPPAHIAETDSSPD